MKIIYIAGPMTGYEKHNCPAFDSACQVLREWNKDAVVISPPDITRMLGHDPENVEATGSVESYRFYMRQDIHTVMNASEVWALPGWERSNGAKLEVLLAQTLGIPVYEFATGELKTLRVFTDTEPVS